MATAIIQVKDNNSNLGGCNGQLKEVSNLKHILEVRPKRPADTLQVEYDVRDSQRTSKFLVEQLAGRY